MAAPAWASAPMTVTVLHGDCLEILPTLAADSIDACVTDPPYHLTSIVKRFAQSDAAREQYAMANDHKGYRALSAGFMGKAWDGGDIAFRPETWAAIYRVLKPGAHLLSFGGTRTYHRMACAIEDAGFEVRDCIMWVYGSGFPKSHDVSKAIDRAAGAEREDKFKGAFERRAGPTGNKRCEVCGKWLRSGSPCQCPRPQDTAITDAARQWQGWGTALKPACEPIVVARKPLSEKTIAANVQRWGTGAINVDGCRVVVDGEDNPSIARRKGATLHLSTRPARETEAEGKMADRSSPEAYRRERDGEKLGRWPANLCHDGSEEVTRLFPDAGGGFGVRGESPNWGPASKGGGTFEQIGFGDNGSAARFFYTAKADTDDRLGSKHPTVKPVDLIAYLVRLVTPPGGTVLDPFAGSGTTGMACMREGFDCILIEREAEYVADINKRIAHVGGEDTPLFAAAEYDGQKDFAGSLDEGYRAIRERMAAGGPGWTPRNQDDDLPRP